MNKKWFKPLIISMTIATLSAITIPVVVSCSSNDNNNQNSITKTNISISLNGTQLNANENENLNLTPVIKCTSDVDENLITYKWQISNESNGWEDIINQNQKELNILVDKSFNNKKIRLQAFYNNQVFTSNSLLIIVDTSSLKPVEPGQSIKDIKFSIGNNQLDIIQGVNFDLSPKLLDEDRKYLDQNFPNWEFEWLLNNKVIINSSEHNNDWFIVEDRNKAKITFFNFQQSAKIKCRILLNNQMNNYIDSNEINVVVQDNLNKPEKPLTNNQKEFMDDGYSAIGSYYAKITDPNVPRPTNVQMYETDLWRQYHDTYGFIYPGWNRNYEEGNNFIFENKNNPYDFINFYPLVFDETIGSVNPNFKNEKFNDTTWIKSEINNNTFKKHPAADNFYESNISNLKAVKKDFVFSTGTKGPATLGLYVPAGEVVTIKFDDETFNLMQQNNWTGISFVINQNYWNNRGENDSGRISNRYPFIQSSFSFSNHIDLATKTMKIASPFGGGLSLWIDSPLLTYPDQKYNPSCACLKFSISGAVECMQYIDGYTSENEWNKQIELAKKQQLAPVLQANSTYFALSIPFTGIGQIGHTNVDQLVYPKNIFQKWNDFLFLSNYGAGRDIDHNLNRLDMEFCDDIWGGAGAWGGGDHFYCSTSWGINCFFVGNPVELFSPSNNWGVFHEINHNFQQNGAFFNKRGHGETNQMSMFNLSVIGDVGRYRNELNWNGEGTFRISDVGKSLGWTRLDNAFINIADCIKGNYSDEYPLYANLLYLMGSKNYIDYVRYDVRNDWSSASGWNGLHEIEQISNSFKLNFWPAMQNYGRWWNDNWPTDYNSATNEQKAIIDNLARKYPAIDFVGNMYACGNYIYDSINNTYIYGGDTNTPYEIIANQNKVFDLKNFIMSTNPNFAWDDLEFNPTTALGATLSFNKNTKELTYVPAPNTCNKTDEFDITIKPSNFLNKPSYYVPGYKFKIKVRLIANCGTLNTYKISRNGSFEELNNASKITSVPYTRNGNYIFSTNMKANATEYDASVINFKFIAPATGTYQFKAKFDDWYRLLINNQEVYKKQYYTPDWTNVYSINLTKGQELNISNQIINTGGMGSFELALTLNNESISLFDNIVVSDYLTNNTNNVFGSYRVDDLLNNKYHPRNVNYNIYNSSLSNTSNDSDYKYQTIDHNNYDLSSIYTSSDVNNLNYNHTWWEIWQSNSQSDCRISFTATSKNGLLDASAIVLSCRDNNWFEARPTSITVKVYDENNNEQIAYDGIYPTRGANYSIINFDKTYHFKKMYVEMYNKSFNAISLDTFTISPHKIISFSNSFGFNNDLMKVDPKWIFKNNDDTNISGLNNCYVSTKESKAVIEFNLNNSYGFNIVGQKNNNLGAFDVYINGELYQTVDTNHTNRIDNSILFSFKQDITSLLTVRIETKSSSPVILNYISTFGNNTSLI